MVSPRRAPREPGGEQACLGAVERGRGGTPVRGVEVVAGGEDEGSGSGGMARAHARGHPVLGRASRALIALHEDAEGLLSLLGHHGGRGGRGDDQAREGDACGEARQAARGVGCALADTRERRRSRAASIARVTSSGWGAAAPAGMAARGSRRARAMAAPVAATVTIDAIPRKPFMGRNSRDGARCHDLTGELARGATIAIGALL